MKTSNKVLLTALGVLLALFLAFILTMSFRIRDLMQQRGRTAHAAPVPVAELSYVGPIRAAGFGDPAPVPAPLPRTGALRG